MRRSSFLLALLVPLLAHPAARCAAETPRNVLLLIADDLGLQLGCYGDRSARTPHLDALAKRGVRFTHAFAAVSSCSPSRAAIYTGLHTHTSGQYGLAHGVHNFHTRPGVRSLPTYLNAAGYSTAILGKVHVLPRSCYPFGEEISKVKGGFRSPAGMAEQARRFFGKAGARPFCLVVGFADPHRAARGFDNDKPHPGAKDHRFDPKTLSLPYFLPDTPEARADLADYYRAAHRLDQGVGMVLDELRKSGHDKDTLVIFLSDNGIPFPGAKTTLYDSGLRLPLIVSSPTQKRRGLVNNAMVSWVDVLPTVLDWAGVKSPPGLAGRSFLSVLEQENPRGWDTAFGSHQCHEVTMYYPMRMVRTRTHKYVRNLAHRLDYPFASDLYDSPTWQGVLKRGDGKLGRRSVEQFVRRPAEELYDLGKDPHELKNVAGDPKSAGVLKELRRRMKEWQTKTKDPWVVKYTHE
jgi:N-sulfoglucosamine sulfohydrolase